ncbi:MAG: hypothetical protein WD059_06900 [Balneolaceae bacterium]
MKRILLFTFFALWFAGTHAQSLQVSTVPSTGNNNTSQFAVGDEQITISNSSLAFNEGAVSADIAHSGISATLGETGISVFETDGTKLINTDYDFVTDDSSLKIYAMGNGGFIVRENIANFLLYNSYGTIRHSVSNSSQSTEGESISELASDPAFKTVVLYNPKIVRNGQEGSRAQLVTMDGGTTDFYNSQDRAIRMVNVTENGQYINIVTYQTGTDDVVLIMDRFGNQLSEIPFDQNIADVRVSNDGRFITIRSNSRVAAHSVLSRERVGSTSFRSTLHFAEYIPEDKTIIALTADKSGSVLSNIEFHAINVAARAIERQAFNSSLGTTDIIPVYLTREGRFNYSISGFSQKLNVKASF